MDDAARDGERASTSRRVSRRRDENETRGTRASEAVDRTERCFAGSEVRTRASSVGGRARRVGATANRERVGRRRASRLEEVAREATYLQPGEVVDPRVRRVFVDELGEIGLHVTPREDLPEQEPRGERGLERVHVLRHPDVVPEPSPQELRHRARRGETRSPPARASQ